MSKTISLADVTKHTEENDLWTVINKKVYNITDFVDVHPGGIDTLLAVAGKDGTDDFNSVGHSDSARAELEKYYIGELNTEDAATLKPPIHGEKSSPVGVVIVIALIAFAIYIILTP